MYVYAISFFVLKMYNMFHISINKNYDTMKSKYTFLFDLVSNLGFFIKKHSFV